MSASSWRLRAAQPADAEFLLRLYCGMRAHEFAGIGWPQAQLHALLVMQYQAQCRHYANRFPAGYESIIEVQNVAAGRLLVQSNADEILVIDVCLLPQFQHRGIGTAVLKEVQDRAMRANQAVVLHVQERNRARRLYERLGFEISARDGMHLEMRWRAQSETDHPGGPTACLTH
jgi:ribosomal protein S18 acetylase RimI-like enzyme